MDLVEQLDILADTLYIEASCFKNSCWTQELRLSLFTFQLFMVVNAQKNCVGSLYVFVIGQTRVYS